MHQILIVEDDPALSQGIRLALGQEGRQFVQAGTIGQAERELAERTFDLLILDLNLPDGNGLDLLSRLRDRSALLVEHRGQTLSREVLLDRVWDGGEFVDENALSVAVNRLRAKLADAPIRTVYGLGYQWAVD